MFKKILIGLVLVLVVLAIVIAMQPGEFKVERSMTMNAPAQAVFDQVNDFHKWEAWSPWAKLDPKCENTFGGKESGVGATFDWKGNNEVGQGKMTIVESTPPSLIRVKLDFIKPFESTSDVEFKFKEKDGKTDVIWSMSGKSNFVGKAICLFMNMDQMIGAYYEKGLTSIKTIVEKPADQPIEKAKVDPAPEKK